MECERNVSKRGKMKGKGGDMENVEEKKKKDGCRRVRQEREQWKNGNIKQKMVEGDEMKEAIVLYSHL